MISTADETATLLVSVRQAARLLGIGRDLTYQLVREGRLQSVCLGRRILVPRRALARFVEAETNDRTDA
jgi:excisionase family DNA binding protein